MKAKKIILACYIFIAVLILGLLAAFTVPFLSWKSRESTPIKAWIVDKTVPDTQYREHKGVMWVLNSRKIVPEETGKPFQYSSDYYGFIPGDGGSYSVKELPDNGDKPDLIYLADTYGVYKDEYPPEGDGEELLYGGLTEEEIAVLRANLGGGNTIIGEFNTNSAETDQELATIFRRNRLGWSGRYYTDLIKGGEVPAATIARYEEQEGTAWAYSGGGFILISDDDKVIVLKEGADTGKKNLTISLRDGYRQEFNTDNSVAYEYWFEFVQPDASAEVLADYKFDLTEEGKRKLQAAGLPESFPAIVRSVNTQYTSYYFAGDYADLNFNGKWWNYAGFSKLKRSFTFSTKGSNLDFYWRFYVPVMEKIIGVIKSATALNADKPEEGELQYTAKTAGTGFQILKDGKWEDFFAKGVNIGSSTPGTWFTNFPDDEEMYLRWFELIAGMKANSIRVYTLQSPQFYNALTYYNANHPGECLWLYQELWPEENPEEGNYLNSDYQKTYLEEIERDIDALHGQANIPARKGRAYGIYTSDVSPYVAGYLVGRELVPDEVLHTNELNTGTTYTGEYLFTEEEASPTEVWLAKNCDYVLSYEADKYQWQHPVGIVSWPTLDPKEHASEWNKYNNKALEYNDSISVDINHISTRNTLQAGFFGAYHIYPNYPDFMNNETSYAEYMDEQGSFRYGGYLKEFIEGHTKYPALVAEFGLATGMGNAHENPDGYHHGSLTEEAQGDGIVRMMKAIHREGYAGGLIFEWTDEWAKKTWITEPYIIPFERNPLWHNAVDPEQNYGIYAMESDTIRSEPYTIEDNGRISLLSLSADETYLHLELEIEGGLDLSQERLLIGLDTYDRSKGDTIYPEGINAVSDTGLEFMIDIKGSDEAQLLVHPGYNTYRDKYASYPSSAGIYEKMSVQTNNERITQNGTVIPAIFQDLSNLKYGTLVDNSYYYWSLENNKLTIRIPWSRLNFTDPSNMRVLNDTRDIPDPVTDELQTVISDGILANAVLVDQDNKDIIATAGFSNKEAFRWNSWELPSYQARLKKSYDIIRDYFKELEGQ